MLSQISSGQITGLEASLVDVEVDISRGIHSFSIVGLPDKAVEEARDRITAAIKNSGFSSPQRGGKKIIISLAPAELKKEGSGFDLGIALGYLLAAGEIAFLPAGKLFLGELALSGELRPVRGTLLLAQKAKQSGFTEIYIPTDNAEEAMLVDDLQIFPCLSLGQVVNYLNQKPGSANRQDKDWKQSSSLKPLVVVKQSSVSRPQADQDILFDVDFADIKGQKSAKRGLVVAAAGRHNVAMAGPPGMGKTMLAKALSGILPPLDSGEIIEATGIHSAAGTLASGIVTRPPFRSPHHTASYVSLVGGGAWPKPGEITLAHRGVLFLDEFPEFDKRSIESLRQPLEERCIQISRQRGSFTFPASFILVAAMNPCPCGWRGTPERECLCLPSALFRYQRKISGPIADRIDLWLDVAGVKPKDLSPTAPSGTEENSSSINQQIVAARKRQAKRFQGTSLFTNSDMKAKQIKEYVSFSGAVEKLLERSAETLHLSARAYHRTIKVALTIADLEEADNIKEEHLLEALQYRSRYWQTGEI